MSGGAGNRLRRAWQQDSPALAPLRPLGALTAGVARRRLRRFRARAPRPPVPVLVVGNITVGGTGKTPLVIALCRTLRARGWSVAVISRGYRARPPARPWPVTADGDPRRCGDEPLMIARAAGVPVMIDPDRARALAWTLERDRPDLVISDDGLQHYALPRTAELAVIDAARGLGNGRCLPAGPLREPAGRLDDVDWLVSRGGGGLVGGRQAWPLELASLEPVHLASGETLPLAEFRARHPRVHALAGIGHPEHFFATLREHGLAVIEHPRADHHVPGRRDLAFEDGLPVVMTEKDAVKCGDSGPDHAWVWPVRAELPGPLVEEIMQRLETRA